MKRSTILGLVGCCMSFSIAACDSADVQDLPPKSAAYEAEAAPKREERIPICHLDDSGQTILLELSSSAVPAHLRHGDRVANADGSCRDLPPFPSEFVAFAEFPEVGGIDAIWAADDNHIFVGGWTGGQGFVKTFKDGVWTDYITNGTVSDIWGFAADDVYASRGAELLHYDGSSWQTVLWGGDYTSVGGFAHPYLYIGGNLGRMYQLNVETGVLTVEYDPQLDGEGGNTRVMFDIWASSADDIWAVGQPGDDGYVTILNRSGGVWSREQTTFRETMAGVVGRGPDEILVVGDGSQVLTYDGQAWSWQDVGNNVGHLWGAVTTGPGTAVIAGGWYENGVSEGAIVFFDHGDLSSYQRYPQVQSFSSICSTESGTIYAAGARSILVGKR